MTNRLLGTSLIVLAAAGCASSGIKAPPDPPRKLETVPRPDPVPPPPPPPGWEGRQVQAVPSPPEGGYVACVAGRSDHCSQAGQIRKPHSADAPVRNPGVASAQRGLTSPGPGGALVTGPVGSDGPQTTSPAANNAFSGACAPGDLDCGTAAGRGAFAEPPEMWVDVPASLVFAVAPSDQVLNVEIGPNREAAAAEDIRIGRCMRVTLEDHPAFTILSPNGTIQKLSRDRDRASWRWMVKPKDYGDYDLRARVEVVKMVDDKCTDLNKDNYKSEVDVRVNIGFWKSFLRGLREARNASDLLGALFQSGKTTLVSLSALIAAFAGVVAAVRALRRRKGPAPQPEKAAA